MTQLPPWPEREKSPKLPNNSISSKLLPLIVVLLVSAETSKSMLSDVKVLHSAPGMLTVSLAECAAWYLTAAAQTANFRPWLPHFSMFLFWICFLFRITPEQNFTSVVPFPWLAQDDCKFVLFSESIASHYFVWRCPGILWRLFWILLKKIQRWSSRELQLSPRWFLLKPFSKLAIDISSWSDCDCDWMRNVHL